jgi:hypothetical protein
VGELLFLHSCYLCDWNHEDGADLNSVDVHAVTECEGMEA